MLSPHVFVSSISLPCGSEFDGDISSRIAGPGELFSSDIQAGAQSPRWATRCSLGSISCSCDAAPRTAVRKRALPVGSSLLTEQRRTWLIYCRAGRNLSSKSLASYSQSKKRKSKVVRRRRDGRPTNPLKTTHKKGRREVVVPKQDLPAGNTRFCQSAFLECYLWQFLWSNFFSIFQMEVMEMETLRPKDHVSTSVCFSFAANWRKW